MLELLDGFVEGTSLPSHDVAIASDSMVDSEASLLGVERNRVLEAKTRKKAGATHSEAHPPRSST